MPIIIHDAAGLPSGGTNGQVLTKTASGEAWQSVPTELPDGGTSGQLLTKTETGTAWQDAPTVPTKTSELTNDSGYITGYTETDPTVPAWAKAATKPTYTATEVGAAASGHGHALTDSTITGILPLTKGGHGQSTAPLGLYALINGSTALTSSGIATGDYIPIGDISAVTGKKITLANLKTALGISSTGGVVVGTYTGNASRTTTTAQSVTLGFQARFIWVGRLAGSDGYPYAPWYYYNIDEYDDVEWSDYTNKYTRIRYACADSAFTYYGPPLKHETDEQSGMISVLEITSTGFNVANAHYTTTGGSSYYKDYDYRLLLNLTSDTYFYLAVR